MTARRVEELRVKNLFINAHRNCAVRIFLHSILKVILRKSIVLGLRPNRCLKPLALSPVNLLSCIFKRSTPPSNKRGVCVGGNQATPEGGEHFLPPNIHTQASSGTATVFCIIP